MPKVSDPLNATRSRNPQRSFVMFVRGTRLSTFHTNQPSLVNFLMERVEGVIRRRVPVYSRRCNGLVFLGRVPSDFSGGYRFLS